MRNARRPTSAGDFILGGVQGRSRRESALIGSSPHGTRSKLRGVVVAEGIDEGEECDGIPSPVGEASFGGAFGGDRFRRQNPSATSSFNVDHKPTNMKGRILRSFARGDLNRLQTELMLIPLRFTDTDLEKEYASNVHRHYRGRLRFAAVVLLLINAAVWLTVGLGFDDVSSFFIPPEVEYAFHVHEIVACIVAIVTFLIPSIPLVRRVPETAFYWLLAAMFTSHFALMNFSLRSMPTHLDVRGAPLWDFALVHNLKLGFVRLKYWSDTTAFTMYFSCLIGVNLFCQSRTKYSWTVNVYMYLMINTPLWMQYGMFNPIFDYRTTMGLQQILTASIALMSFYARCHRELQERVEFYQLVRARQKLQLARAQLKKSRRPCSTGIEELVHMLTESENIVQSVYNNTLESSLRPAREMLKLALQLVRTTDNLYEVIQPEHDDDGNSKETADIVEAFTGRPKRHVRFSRRAAGDAGNANLARTSALARTKSTKEGGTGAGWLSSLGKVLSGKQKTSQGKAVVDLSKIGSAHSKISKWDFDVLQASTTDPNVLIDIGLCLLLADEFSRQDTSSNTSNESVANLGGGIPTAGGKGLMSPAETPHSSEQRSTVVFNFLEAVQSLYFDNPYHNASHAATVAHTSLLIAQYIGLTNRQSFVEYDRRALIVAAICHDVCHPGRNNAFFVSTADTVAIFYNDRAVLENYHCAITFHLLAQPSQDIFDNLQPEELKKTRTRIVDLILATDMSKHFESLSKVKLRTAASDFSLSLNQDDYIQALMLCIKGGDLSHGAVGWESHKNWSIRVATEFYQQGDDEAELGLVKSPLCDRSSHAGFAKSQKGFLQFVVKPLYETLETIATRSQQENAKGEECNSHDNPSHADHHHHFNDDNDNGADHPPTNTNKIREECCSRIETNLAAWSNLSETGEQIDLGSDFDRARSLAPLASMPKLSIALPNGSAESGPLPSPRGKYASAAPASEVTELVVGRSVFRKVLNVAPPLTPDASSRTVSGSGRSTASTSADGGILTKIKRKCGPVLSTSSSMAAAQFALPPHDGNLTARRTVGARRHAVSEDFSTTTSNSGQVIIHDMTRSTVRPPESLVTTPDTGAANNNNNDLRLDEKIDEEEEEEGDRSPFDSPVGCDTCHPITMSSSSALETDAPPGRFDSAMAATTTTTEIDRRGSAESGGDSK